VYLLYGFVPITTSRADFSNPISVARTYVFEAFPAYMEQELAEFGAGLNPVIYGDQ
jgi:hypothetical protein